MLTHPFAHRLTPARPDLAADHLRGQVEAGSFVRGRPLRVTASLLDMAGRPAPGATRTTQLLHGEAFVVYESRSDGLAWGQAELDGYVGYVRADGLGPPQGPGRQITALWSHVYAEPAARARVEAELPFLATVPVKGSTGGFFRLRDGGFVPRPHLAPVSGDHAAQAERFLGVPYLWGGRSVRGIDCSALVQLALLASGIPAPRDSDMQAALVGTPLTARPRRGAATSGSGRGMSRSCGTRHADPRQRPPHGGGGRAAARGGGTDRRERRRPGDRAPPPLSPRLLDDARRHAADELEADRLGQRRQRQRDVGPHHQRRHQHGVLARALGGQRHEAGEDAFVGAGARAVGVVVQHRPPGMARHRQHQVAEVGGDAPPRRRRAAPRARGGAGPAPRPAHQSRMQRITCRSSGGSSASRPTGVAPGWRVARSLGQDQLALARDAQDVADAVEPDLGLDAAGGEDARVVVRPVRTVGRCRAQPGIRGEAAGGCRSGSRRAVEESGCMPRTSGAAGQLADPRGLAHAIDDQIARVRQS